MVATRTGAKALPKPVRHCHQLRKLCPEEGGLTCLECSRFYCKEHLKKYDIATQVIPPLGWRCYFCNKSCCCSQCILPEELRAKPKRKSKRKREANKDQDHILEITILQEQLSQRDSEILVIRADLEQAKHENIELKEALVKGEEDRKALTKKVLELKGNLRVLCRVRPPLDGERKIEFMKERELIGESVKMYEGILTGKEEKYKFAKVFLEDSPQEEVFDEISDLIQSALDGDKVCIFSFGQTGSGKTYSMLGKEGEHRGIIPRSLEKIFGDREKLKELGWDYHYKVSMVEVYGTHAYDMLQESQLSSDTAIQRVPVRN